jgi:hypothetical protein
MTSETQARTDFLLEYLLTAWQELPSVERTIDDWDLIEQIDYVEEWSVKESLLLELTRCAPNAMTDEQRQKYDELQKVIEKHRPILQRLRPC